MTYYDKLGCMWVTHTYPGNKSIAIDFKKNGWTTIVHSLQKITYIPLNKDQFLLNPSSRIVAIITSFHAIKVLNTTFDKYTTLVGCVGKETAHHVSKAGFHKIIVPEIENGENLAKTLLPYCRFGDLIVHLSGEIIRFDMANFFKNLGFVAKQQITYKAMAKNSIPQFIVERIINKEITHISFYSIGAVEIFSKLFVKYNLTVHHLTAVCLSKEIAKQCIAVDPRIGKFKDVEIL